jgi:hypothetical protein
MYRVWPLNAPLNGDNFTTIPIGGRCSECRLRIDYDVQCKHELCVDPTFKVKCNNQRWLNEESFDTNYPLLSPMLVTHEAFSEISKEVKTSSNCQKLNLVRVNQMDDGDVEDECAAKVNDSNRDTYISINTNVEYGS